jgi:formylglycine-generating enzyme required for sulfatase activity
MCPSPLVLEANDCARPRLRIDVPKTHLVIGASDWEAEGRVQPREADVDAFAIDAFEVTRGEIDPSGSDHARAASRVTRIEAADFCDARGGRLPTDDEWTAAAAGAGGRRYPWGDTGAVCRRGAWGLASGPCAENPWAGPDTVAAHPDGNTASGIYDLAGNVAEWVAPDPSDPARGVVRGGSFRSPLAADLRTWARQEVEPKAREDWIGFRCAYDSGR